MEKKYRSIALKANRTLGSRLVELDLVPLEQLEKANETLLQELHAGEPHISVLRILLFGQQALNETEYLNYQIKEFKLAALQPARYNITDAAFTTFNIDHYWATWTILFDKIDNIYFLCTTYYLSPFVREYWETLVDGAIIWYTAEFTEVQEILERQQRLIDNPNSTNGDPTKPEKKA